jgi:hypothetical protein
LKLSNLNEWLALGANLGVLAGIVFLSLEIDQSNRIAIREARSELLDFRTDLNIASWENADVAALMVKLTEISPELSPIEEYRAHSFASLQITQAINLNANYEEGFISDEILNRNMNGSRNVIRGLPGLAPYLRQAVEQLELSEAVFSEGGNPALRNLGEEVLRIERLNQGYED